MPSQKSSQSFNALEVFQMWSSSKTAGIDQNSKSSTKENCKISDGLMGFVQFGVNRYHEAYPLGTWMEGVYCHWKSRINQKASEVGQRGINYGIHMLGIRSYSAMKLGWSCILIRVNLSEGLQGNKTTYVMRQKQLSLRVRIWFFGDTWKVMV